MKTEAKARITMKCPDCDTRCASFGKHRNGLRRFRCGDCGTTYTELHEKPLGEMTIPMEKAILVLKLLLEGASVRSVERAVDIHRDTILRLLVLAGEKCERIMARYIRNVPVQDMEIDEVWDYIGKKEKRVRPDDDQNLGDCYTFVAIERTSKLVLNAAMGKRDQQTTNAFIEGLRDTVAPGRFQITTDGFAVQNVYPGHFRQSRRLRDAHHGLSRCARGRTPIFSRRSAVRGGSPRLRQSRSWPSNAAI
jgi:transposase-like protein